MCKMDFKVTIHKNQIRIFESVFRVSTFYGGPFIRTVSRVLSTVGLSPIEENCNERELQLQQRKLNETFWCNKRNN